MMGSKKQLLNSNNSSKDVPEFNIALLGALGVGKSALAVKYLTRRFIMEYDPYLEDTYTKNEFVDGHEISVKVMDTCDTEHSKPERYQTWAHGYVVVYSITSRPSFDAAKSYLEAISALQRNAEKDLPVALIGNKSDLERYRTVSKVAGESLAAEFECLFSETSAADDLESVENVFHETLRNISAANDGPLALEPLFISEEQQSSARVALRRTKSPKTPESLKKGDKTLQRKTVSTFKIFNKGFKIFN